MTPRETLKRCCAAALAAVDGRRVTAEALAGPASPLLPSHVPVLAMGKAATAMLAGAADALGPAIGPALAVTRPDSVRPGEPGVAAAEVIYGDHPVPGAASLAAGRRVTAFCSRLDPRGSLLVLLSGGASALVEHPAAGVSRTDLGRANRWLLASGLAISEVNAVRRRLSAIKGGGLARATAARRVVVLAVSDVPGNAPEVIGSGPFSATAAPALPGGLPAWLQRLVAKREAPGNRSPSPEVDFRVVADADAAAGAAVAWGRFRGFEARLHEPLLAGGTIDAVGRLLADHLEAAGRGIHVWRGETSPVLPPAAGRGGRNRHLALGLALALESRRARDITLLCTATDGSDGSGDAAGGWADPDVAARIRACGLDPAAAFTGADSGPVLEAAGQAFVTGPTGTNVMDLVLAVSGSGLCAGQPPG
ncbi:MAG: DUF4147 domain-containing protein [Gammaproteobacteria bacterium]